MRAPDGIHFEWDIALPELKTDRWIRCIPEQLLYPCPSSDRYLPVWNVLVPLRFASLHLLNSAERIGYRKFQPYPKALFEIVLPAVGHPPRVPAHAPQRTNFHPLPSSPIVCCSLHDASASTQSKPERAQAKTATPISQRPTESV